MGTARRSWHALHGRKWADATNPTAAMRSGIVQERRNAMPAPFERPSA
jgi:hypothetical protein